MLKWKNKIKSKPRKWGRGLLLGATFTLLILGQLTVEFATQSRRSKVSEIPLAKLLAVQGESKLTRPDGIRSDVGVGAALRDHDLLAIQAASSAMIQLGAVQLRGHSQTEIQFTRHHGISAVELRSGSFSATVHGQEHLAIEFPGSPSMEVETDQNCEFFALIGPDQQPMLQIISGSLRVRTQQQVVTLGEYETFQPRSIKIRATSDIIFLQTKPNNEYASSEDFALELKWKLPGKISVPKLTLEFSEDPLFTAPFLSQPLIYKNEFTAFLNHDQEFYYRLVDPEGRVSPVQRVSFTRLLKPKLAPRVMDLATKEDLNLLDVSIGSDPRAQSVLIQISQDPEFRRNFVNERAFPPRWSKQLPPAHYWIRAKNIYAQNQQSAWSSPQYIVVNPLSAAPATWPEMTSLGLYIESISYPREWLSLTKTDLQEKLRGLPDLRDYFAPLRAKSRRLSGIEIRSSTGEKLTQFDSDSLPASWIIPGSQRLQFRSTQGAYKTGWSEPHALDLSIAPPHWVTTSHVTRVAAGTEDWTKTFTWNKIFFAASYEIESRSSQNPHVRHLTRTSHPQLQVHLVAGEAQLVRVRGLGEAGAPISQWSEPLTLKLPASIDETLAAPLAQNSEPLRTGPPLNYDFYLQDERALSAEDSFFHFKLNPVLDLNTQRIFAPVEDY